MHSEGYTESNTDPTYNFPTDVLLTIFEHILGERHRNPGESITTLMRLCRWIHDWIEKRIYRTVVITSELQLIEYLKSVENHPRRRRYLDNLSLRFSINNQIGGYWAFLITDGALGDMSYLKSFNFILPPRVFVFGVYRESFWQSFDVSRLTHLRLDNYYSMELIPTPCLDWRITHFGIKMLVDDDNMGVYELQLHNILSSLGSHLQRFAVVLWEYIPGELSVEIQSPALVVLGRNESMYHAINAVDDTGFWVLVESEYMKQHGPNRSSNKQLDDPPNQKVPTPQ